MKVPVPMVPQKRSSAEPKIEEKNSAKEAQGLRYAEAANEAGHSWRCGGLGRVRWFTAGLKLCCPDKDSSFYAPRKEIAGRFRLLTGISFSQIRVTRLLKNTSKEDDR